MKKEFENIKKGSTVGELYNPAIEIAKEGDKEKAHRYFSALVEHCVEMSREERPEDNVDENEAIKIVHSNIGYWAGYFEKGTIEKVHEVFGSSHPVFGNSTPSTTDAFNAGMELGKSARKK